MPDTLEPAGGGRYPTDMESRVAVLEQIARSLLSGQERIERRFDVVDRRFDAVDRRVDILGAKQNADFRWLLGIILGGFGAMLGGFSAVLGVVAHGFHWL
jgi:hypothetical protein